MIDFVDDFDKYIVAREVTEAKVEHFHVFIHAGCTKDTIVNHARKYLKIPKGLPGKANKYFMCKEWDMDIDYFCKDGDIILSEGYSLEELQKAQERGNLRYNKTQLASSPEPSAGSARRDEVAEKKYRLTEWEHLINDSTFLTENVCYTPAKTARQWKIWICAKYISAERCVPRTGDLNRYAYSLFMIHNSKDRRKETDENKVLALVEDYVDSLEKDFVYPKYN